MAAVPFNIKLLQITDPMASLMQAVQVLDFFDGATKNFHPDGLFSTKIFGAAGTEQRSSKFSYIDMKLPIFHPIIYKRIVKMKAFYGDIMAGKEYATWDVNLSDFVRSNALTGETGYTFFLKHWKKIKFEETDTISRRETIELIEKYKDTCTTSRLLVIPAGYRDLEIDEHGQQSSDEVNGLYQKVLSTSNTIHRTVANTTPEAYDHQRVVLQRAFIEIYELFEKVVEGKKALLLNKWAGRNIFNGTRNVITAQQANVEFLGSHGNPGFNNTSVGIYQTLKGILPISKYLLRTGFLSEVFTSVTTPALLTDKKTLKSVRVTLKHSDFDEWMTGEGMEKVIESFSEESIRHDPVEIDDYYLGLMYKGPDGTFKLIHGIDELPEGRLAKDCTPLTLAELFYCSIYFKANTYPLLVTRYPITGMGSIYTSFTFLESTIVTEVRKELGTDWTPMGPERVAYRFPTLTSFYNSLSPHGSRLAGLGADFDGDTASANFLYSDEAIESAIKMLKSRNYYVGSDGKINVAINTDTVKYVVHNLARGRKKAK